MSDNSTTNQKTPEKIGHTPGPWKIEANRLERTIIGNLTSHKNMTATTVARVFGNETSQLLTQANANLIAAAPELLEVCKELREAMRIALNIMRNNPDEWEVLDSQRKECGIRDGIGKRSGEIIDRAEGRES